MRIGSYKQVKKMEKKRNVAGLIEALRHKDWVGRRNAAIALGNIGDVSAIEPLIEAIKFNEDMVSFAAFDALAMMNDVRAVEPLIRALDDEDFFVQWSAIRSLGKIGDTRAVEPIIRALKDGEIFVREEAAKSLGNIRDARAVEPLIQALEDKVEFVREATINALQALMYEDRDTRERVANVLDELGFQLRDDKERASTNLTLKDLFSKSEKLTFLVGAGCSVDVPSCLPTGRSMMEAIIKYTCAESEIENVLKVENLRFEALVEIIRDTLDKELKIIEYYSQCNKPNNQHFFLAEMIKKGHFVMTTNFDFLIEYALLKSDIPKKEIIPIITEKDFHNYNDPNKLFKKKKKTVYKIHGSTKNIITGEDTRDSLIATIQSFGTNKEGLNVFQVEPFKAPLFKNISNGRSLVVIGYSGSDDFDIIPTLKILKNLQNVIWINYIRDDGGKEEIYEIDDNYNFISDKVNQILIGIHRMKNAVKVYRVNVNTSKILKDLVDFKINVSRDNFSLNPIDWFKNTIKTPNEAMKFLIPQRIYFTLGKYNDSLRCANELFHIAERIKSQSWKSIALQCIGMAYRMQGNYPEALKRYELALQIDEQLGSLSMKANSLNSIGLISQAQGNFSEALNQFEKALEINEQLGQLSGQATVMNNIGETYRMQGNYPEALKRYEMALQIDEQLGNLSMKAISLNNIGLISQAQGNFSEALEKFMEALQIDEGLGDLPGKALRLNNIGLTLQYLGNDSEALEWYEKSLNMFDQLGDLASKAKILNNVGSIYLNQENDFEALKRFKIALQLAEDLGDLANKALSIYNIGGVYFFQGNDSEALKMFNDALQILIQIGLSETSQAKKIKKNIEYLKNSLEIH